ncbi:unnamed protein product [Adineta steineri]|uniref:Tetratricopeptide repeat protein n=1 Tax=Adineta steineri TaxID=433720 RepID=A0A814A0W5_9BILA|nr:unnamed protein product [Adineta steineri]CAF3924813.1 unnamed protein product [Adineta steineri]
MPRDSSQAKREMLAECRAYYRGNDHELARINEFARTYRSADAINWYTRDCFLYRLVNKALRTEDIRALYRFRFFIVDMCARLEEEAAIASTYHNAPFRVYRGSQLGRDEVEQMRIGTLVATNGYLSTSRHLNVAQIFIGIDSDTGMSPSRSRKDRRQYVLFEIDVDLAQSTDVVVVDVSGQSAIPDENEIIFNLGTTFIITHIMYDDEHYLWHAQMVSSSEVAELNRHYNEYVRGHLADVNATLLFGQFLAEISGDYAETIVYFHRLLRRLSADDEDRPNIYYFLGRAYRFIGKYQQAITYFRCAQLLQRRKVPQWSFDCGRTLGVLGTVYSEMGDLTQAIRLEEKALAIHSYCLPQDHVEMVDNWNRLAYAYWQEKNYERALIMLSNSLSLSKKKMPVNYPNHAQVVCTMGLVQHALGNREEALNYLKQSLQMRESLLADDHPVVARTCYELGIIYAERDDEHTLALQYARRALHIQEVKLPPNHRELMLTMNLVQRISQQNNCIASL